jgi:hypothetical protein
MATEIDAPIGREPPLHAIVQIKFQVRSILHIRVWKKHRPRAR